MHYTVRPGVALGKMLRTAIMLHDVVALKKLLGEREASAAAMLQKTKHVIPRKTEQGANVSWV